MIIILLKRNTSLGREASVVALVATFSRGAAVGVDDDPSAQGREERSQRERACPARARRWLVCPLHERRSRGVRGLVSFHPC